MESGSCPFLSKDLLARIPESKRQELEKYYSQMNKKSGGGGGLMDDVEEGGVDMIQMMQNSVDEEMTTATNHSMCPAAKVDAVVSHHGAIGGGKGACPFFSSSKILLFNLEDLRL